LSFFAEACGIYELLLNCSFVEDDGECMLLGFYCGIETTSLSKSLDDET